MIVPQGANGFFVKNSHLIASFPSGFVCETVKHAQRRELHSHCARCSQKSQKKTIKKSSKAAHPKRDDQEENERVGAERRSRKVRLGLLVPGLDSRRSGRFGVARRLPRRPGRGGRAGEKRPRRAPGRPASPRRKATVQRSPPAEVRSEAAPLGATLGATRLGSPAAGFRRATLVGSHAHAIGS